MRNKSVSYHDAYLDSLCTIKHTILCIISIALVLYLIQHYFCEHIDPIDTEAIAGSLIGETFADMPHEPRSSKTGAGDKNHEDMVSSWWRQSKADSFLRLSRWSLLVDNKRKG